MTLIYSKNGAKITGIDGNYRNPLFFTKAEPVEQVLADAHYEQIEQAYQAQGVTVKLISEQDSTEPTEPKRKARAKKAEPSE